MRLTIGDTDKRIGIIVEDSRDVFIMGKLDTMIPLTLNYENGELVSVYADTQELLNLITSINSLK